MAKGQCNGEVYSTCLYECIQVFSKNFVFLLFALDVLDYNA